MRLLTGTSGFAYREWKGSFYPDDLPASAMLRFYAARFPAVEINNTFRRMPEEDVLRNWTEQVPEDFTFALKAPQQITHHRRLKDADEPVEQFVRMAATLGGRLGPMLFQLPPNMKKDMERLTSFLPLLPAGARAAFEFRHASWFDEEVYDALRAHGAALCIAHGEVVDTPPVATAGWGYLRLRQVTYEDGDLESWVGTVRAQPWTDAFVFFKHEDTGSGPRLARRFAELFQALDQSAEARSAESNSTHG